MHDQHQGLLLHLTNVLLVTADSVDGQAGHVQDGPASVMDDAAKKEVQGVVAQLQQAAVVVRPLFLT